jgi:hypothetical protein
VTIRQLLPGSCRSKHSMPIVQLISMMAACLHFSYSCVCIPTEENMLADAASRFQYSKLFQLAPQLGRMSSTTRSQLTGLKRTLTSLDTLPSTSGMAWHPALKKHIHQVSDPTSILLESAPPFSMPLGNTSQQKSMLGSGTMI